MFVYTLGKCFNGKEIVREFVALNIALCLFKIVYKQNDYALNITFSNYTLLYLHFGSNLSNLH